MSANEAVTSVGRIDKIKRGLFRLWLLLTLVWFVLVALVGLSGAVRDWRLWAMDMSNEGIVDRTLAWVPSFRIEPLTDAEVKRAVRAMDERSSLIVFAQAHPSAGRITFDDVLDDSSDWPAFPSYEQVESIPVGSPPKVMQVRFLDGAKYEIEFPREFGDDLSDVKARIRKFLLGLCEESPRRCHRTKPGIPSMLAEQGGILLAPPLVLLLLGASLMWVARGFLG